MVVCLLLDLGLKAAFEFKGKVILENGDPLDQPPDHSLVVIRHRLLMLIQKGFKLIQFLLQHRQFLLRRHRGAKTIAWKRSRCIAPKLLRRAFVMGKGQP